MQDKKNLMQHIEYIYNNLQFIEKEFKNTTNEDIKELLKYIDTQMIELLNNKILEDASKNGVTIQNIEIYKSSKLKMENIFENIIMLRKDIQKIECNYVVMSNIENIETYVRINLINKMNNKISIYNKKIA